MMTSTVSAAELPLLKKERQELRHRWQSSNGHDLAALFRLAYVGELIQAIEDSDKLPTVTAQLD